MPLSTSVRSYLETEMMPLRERKSLAEEAADALRDLILLKKLTPGEAIPERDVAETLGVSRTPMREALRLLEIEGLVNFTATRRARVANPSLVEISQYLIVLGALEALAGECACAQAHAEDIETVNCLNQKMFDTSDTADPLDFFATDMEFHRAIVLASHNPPLIETHRQYNARLWRARFISSRRRQNRDRTLRQHGDIAAAVTARDEKACAKALRGHLDTALINIRGAFGETGAEQRNPKK